MPSTSGRAPPASGTSISGAGNSTQPTAKVGPTPSRRCTAAVTTEPITLPIAPAPITRPSAPAFTCSVLVANRIQSAKNMKLNRLMVAVAPSEARMIGLRAMNRSPAITPPLAGVRVGLWLGRVDPAHEQRRGHERERVRGHRQRRRQRLHQQAADGGAGHERHRPAAVQQRAAADELLARHQHHEQGVVGDPEQHASGCPPETRRRTSAPSTARPARPQPGSWPAARRGRRRLRSSTRAGRRGGRPRRPRAARTAGSAPGSAATR